MPAAPAPPSTGSPVLPARVLPSSHSTQSPRLALRRPPRVSPRQDLAASIGDAASYSVMVGIGETYFAAFALALGTGETFAGLVATMPMMLGSVLQLATPWALRRCGSYRTWVVLCASLQAAALLAMPIAALFLARTAAVWVMVAASLYWAASQATGPAWNTWIEEIIPKRVRANFFACRARTSQVCVLLGFVAGGLALQAGQSSGPLAGHAHGWLLAAFAAIFLIGSACRFLSAGFLSRQSEPSRGKYHTRSVSLGQLFSVTNSDVGGRLVLYLLAVQVAVQISGPYFTPFMLAQ
jgi:MFS family permease